MYTKQDLMNAMTEMGLQSTDTILIHSSMKSIGEVEGGADTVLDVFMEYFVDGLLILPTHTWANMSETHNIYDPENEPSCVGLLTNLFRKREGVHRSLHPTHSLAAFGKDSIDFLQGEDNITTPCSPEGCYNRLRERNAKILLLGVNHSRNTYLHCVEEVLQVPDRLTLSPVWFQIVMPDGNLKTSNLYRHYNSQTAHISQNYTKLEQAFYDKKAAKQVRFGDATCILCDVNKLFETTKQVLSHNLNCIIELDKISSDWWK